ncbi:ABC transporter permease [Calidifontibacter sp. DB0510]|uniref:Transport permease protein n=1 Tax=Metallococcus carri TaxID=1656884 RepID=A0A967AX59_9MICO|nr:ABC transporter permease [Metallococcus carri]NHN54614.1 ABC transporter permease [Metallococcus carri]NOP36547.1 ABC transporter permease [Calidifontibacter sp. DB2511S]
MSYATRIGRIYADRKILWTLVRRDLRIRYARSVLGYLWTLIDPLAMTLVYGLVFGIIYRARGEGSSQGSPFVLYLVAGLLAWNWFNNAINETSRALYAERLLVRSTNLPREMWVIRVVLSKGIEHLMSLPILLGFIAFFAWRGDVAVNWRIVYWIPALIMELLLCIGMGLVMAPVTALVDDFVRLVRIGLRMLFYLTPIVYSAEMLGKRAPWAKHLQQFNPLTAINDMYRLSFLKPGVSPDYHAWIAGGVVTLLWLVFGLWVFRKLEPAVLKEI